MVAFIIPLHGPENLQFCQHGVQLGSQLPHLLGQVIPALGPVLLPQGIAGNGVVRCRDLFLGFAQFLAAEFQVGLGLMMLPLTGICISSTLRCKKQFTKLNKMNSAAIH